MCYRAFQTSLLHSSQTRFCQSIIDSTEPFLSIPNLTYRCFPLPLQSLPVETKTFFDDSLALLTAFLVSSQSLLFDASPLHTLFLSFHQFSIQLNLSISFSEHSSCSIDLIDDLIYILQSANQRDVVTNLVTPSMIPIFFPLLQRYVENSIVQESKVTWLGVAITILESFDRLKCVITMIL